MCSKHPTYFEDIRDQRAIPKKVKLYNLNAKKMEKTFDVLSCLKWSAGGGKPKQIKKFKALNCTGMAAVLLVRGGIRKLFPEKEQRKIFKEVPLDFSKRFKKAKEKLTQVEPAEDGAEGTIPHNSFGGKIARVWVKIWNTFRKLGLAKGVLPNNFFDPLHKAREYQRENNKRELNRYLKERRQNKEAMCKVLNERHGFSVGDLLHYAKNDFVKICQEILENASGKKIAKKQSRKYKVVGEQSEQRNDRIDRLMNIRNKFRKLLQEAEREVEESSRKNLSTSAMMRKLMKSDSEQNKLCHRKNY